jgi:hypothetical protein
MKHMTTRGGDQPATKGIRFAVILAGLLLLAVILLTPVRGWLNQVPYLWQVLYPLLTLLAGYLLYSASRAREGGLTMAKWALLLASAACASAYFLLGLPYTFFTLGRWGAIVFIAVEVVHSLAESLSGDVGPGTT